MTGKHKSITGQQGGHGSGRWVLALLLAGSLCDLGLAVSAKAAEVTPPDAIAKAGKIVYCSDISGPPLEYYDENSKPIGSDIDIGTEIARRMGVAAEFNNTAFGGLIPALQANHCDAIISQLIDRVARRAVVDFIDYQYSSNSLLVRTGNPKKIHSLDDISGQKIAVESGTAVLGMIQEQNKKFVAAGRPEANAIVYPKDTDALQALQIGQADVYGTTLESAAYFILKAPDIFEVAGPPFARVIDGIAVRKDEPELRTAIQKAFDSMRADGSYLKILTKWHLEGDAL
jgi:polar amino acid transport system substrate-binding protein